MSTPKPLSESEVNAPINAMVVISGGKGRYEFLLRWNVAELPRPGDVLDLNELPHRKDRGWYDVKEIVWKMIIADRTKQTSAVYDVRPFIVVRRRA